VSEPALLPLPLLWSGVGALRRDPRATETEPRKRGGGTRDPEGEREKVGTPSGREDDGRTEEDESGENWRELDARKGKEAERDEGTLEVPEESTRGNPGLRARGTPGPCGVCRGGSSPMCGTPCCSHLYRLVRHRPT